jgi:hypothetical protein
MRVKDWHGNTGFSLSIGSEIVAEVQGHYFVDFGDEIMWHLYEALDADCEHDGLYFKTKKGVYNSVAEHLTASDRSVQYCTSCGDALVLTSAERCFICGVIQE